MTEPILILPLDKAFSESARAAAAAARKAKANQRIERTPIPSSKEAKRAYEAGDKAPQRRLNQAYARGERSVALTEAQREKFREEIVRGRVGSRAGVRRPQPTERQYEEMGVPKDKRTPREYRKRLREYEKG